MSHDIYAAWAASELANNFKLDPSLCFQEDLDPADLSVFATREGRSIWPVSDGVIKIEQGQNTYDLALEFKRENEGLHGVLTALGQSFAYIYKGFSGSVIIVPNKYDSFANPAEYLNDIVNRIAVDQPVAVFGYDKPDTSLTSPFKNRLVCYRKINVRNRQVGAMSSVLAHSSSETQWAHLREGSSEPSAFFRYLQIAKTLGANAEIDPEITLPADLCEAVKELDARATSREAVLKYLANAWGDSFHDNVWRKFWFKFVLTGDTLRIWNKVSNRYEVNGAPSLLEKSDGSGYKKFFCGRRDSIKDKIVEKLNVGTISEKKAWVEYAENVHNRAHSYREDIDSGLDHLGLLEIDGKPSDLGYRFVDACERNGDPNSGTPKAILANCILKNGQLGAFLHYVYKLSESVFRDDPFAFTTNIRRHLKFDESSYLNWLTEKLSNDLAVLNKASLRGGSQRKPFQGELAILRNYGLVRKFRIGVGLEVNWPAVQESLEYDAEG